MTTRYEAELREIEQAIARPKKGQQITEGMRNHVKIQREREAARDQRTKDLGGEIHLSWPEGEPKKWEEAIAQVVIGTETNAYIVEPYEEVEGKTRLKRDVVTRGYNGIVEAWALWRWHIARGSEVDDADRFILDCDAPAFVWEVTEIKKPRKAQSAAHAE